MGADVLEFDVHLTKDCVPIVIHDDHLKRCSDIKGKFPEHPSTLVNNYTWKEISRLDAGSWFVDQLEKSPKERIRFLRLLTEQEELDYISPEERKYYQSGEVRHPTLEEVLLFAQNKSCYLNIEIKQLPRFYPDIAKLVVQTVEKCNMLDRVWVSSFDHYQLVEVKRYNPNIPTAILCKDRLYNPGDYCVDIVGADAYHPCCYGPMDSVGFFSSSYKDYGQLLNEAVMNARSRGLHVNAWTINIKKYMKMLLKIGATGIITDYLNRLQEVISDLS